jgi:hypothetical protein
MIKNTWYVVVLLSLFFAIACQKSYVKKEPIKGPRIWSDVVAFAQQHLPKSGVLVQKEDGYAYVKVDDNYINQLFSRLNLVRGFKKPPYFRRDDAPGAHISVVYKDEHVVLKEIGQHFTFTLKDIVIGSWFRSTQKALRSFAQAQGS